MRTPLSNYHYATGERYVCTTPSTQDETKSYDPNQFGYEADPNGYMLTYRGRPLGGAGVKLPRSKPLHYRHRDANIKMFAESAQREVEQLKAGCGQARFWANVHMIEHSHRAIANPQTLDANTATN